MQKLIFTAFMLLIPSFAHAETQVLFCDTANENRVKLIFKSELDKTTKIFVQQSRNLNSETKKSDENLIMVTDTNNVGEIFKWNVKKIMNRRVVAGLDNTELSLEKDGILAFGSASLRLDIKNREQKKDLRFFFCSPSNG